MKTESTADKYRNFISENYISDNDAPSFEDYKPDTEMKIATDFCSNLNADQVLKIYTNIVMTKVNGSSQYI